MLVTLEDVAVAVCEHLLVDVVANDLRDFLGGRPDVLQVDRVAVLVGAERVLGDVHQQRTGDGIGDDQRRRGQVVGAHVRVDAALEVAIAGQHRAGDQVAIGDGLGDFLRQRAGVADAGCAAVADEVEAEGVEIVLQVGLRQIVGDDLGARRQRGLHPRLDGQALGDGVAGNEAGGNHHARVGGVGARGDRGDHHVAATEIMVAARNRHALADLAGLVPFRAHCRLERRLGIGQGDAVLRALRAGDRRDDVAQVEAEGVGEDRVRRVVGAEHALGLGVGLDQFHAARIAAGGAQVVEGLVVDGEEAAGGAVFRRHVGDGGAIL